jgi:hypothetical protein
MGPRLTAPLLVVLAVLAVYAAGDAIVAARPASASPGFVDTVLASRAVVAAIRMAIIAASCFVIASVAALAHKGRWLTRVGPVHVSDLSGAYAENQQLKEPLEIVDDKMEHLKKQVTESKRLMDQSGPSAGEPK